MNKLIKRFDRLLHAMTSPRQTSPNDFNMRCATFPRHLGRAAIGQVCRLRRDWGSYVFMPEIGWRKSDFG